MKKAILVISLWILGPVAGASASDDTWTTRASMPTARGYLSTAVVDGKIYAFGGALSPTSGTSVVEEYDPLSDAWFARTFMPEIRYAPSTSAVDGNIYLIGGASSLRGAGLPTVYVYNPATDAWTQRADMPTPRQALSTCVVAGKIYAIGGWDGTRTVATVEQYDPATNTWTTKTEMPTARFYPCAEVVNDKIYVIGGIYGETGPVLQAMEEYDPATDTWAQKADMPTARCRFATGAVAGKIYAIGGGLVSGTPFVNVEQYDPMTDSWMAKCPMPTARRALTASVVNAKILAIGGIGSSGTTALSTVEEYDTGLGVPLPDFNSDGMVDIEDLLRLIESWGQNDPLVDLAPLPFGDGVVNRVDLEALMDLWGQEVPDPTLIAHWKLDEAEGVDALDSAGAHDGAVIGTPTWRPDGGKAGGALEFDGATCVLTDSVVNPNGGPFSVFAWIKGGGAGQVIVSQAGGADWLLADPATSALMTDLKELTTRRPTALCSSTVVADGDWHRVGLVWDGVKRSLHVDGVEVATDTQGDLPDSDGGLYLGCGQDAAPETFFTGLIDDVRIYDRAVSP